LGNDLFIVYPFFLKMSVGKRQPLKKKKWKKIVRTGLVAVAPQKPSGCPQWAAI